MNQSEVLIAVNGTLMRGLELNPNMVAAGATFVRETETEAAYRLWTINDKHPAMLRVTDGTGSKIAVEVWSVPAAGLVGILMSERPDYASERYGWTTEASSWVCWANQHLSKSIERSPHTAAGVGIRHANHGRFFQPAAAFKSGLSFALDVPQELYVDHRLESPPDQPWLSRSGRSPMSETPAGFLDQSWCHANGLHRSIGRWSTC